MQSLADELEARGIEYKWYLHKDLAANPTIDADKALTHISQVYDYQPDVIFVPGNEVPWYLTGLKVQIFHGLAGEKKGHFRVRDYFDLYLTQGPYFTKRFDVLAKKHGDFRVIQTGWPKLDSLFVMNKLRSKEEPTKDKLYTILYAPTFSPSLTSAPFISEQLVNLSKLPQVKLVVKFHDKMASELKEQYQALASDSFVIETNPDIRDSMIAADLMISDTSSVVYEFLLLNKPVITLNSTSENILWDDVDEPQELERRALAYIAGDDPNAEQRQAIVDAYHPYTDGLSAARMIDACLSELKQSGRPATRKLSLHRKIKLYKMYKYLPSWKYWFK